MVNDYGLTEELKLIIHRSICPNNLIYLRMIFVFIYLIFFILIFYIFLNLFHSIILN
jgi:hypothetical protein